MKEVSERRRYRVGSVAIAALLLAGSVNAQSFNYTVNLQNDLGLIGEVVASGVHWSCKGHICRASGPWPTPGLGACVALAAKVGRVLSYGYPGRGLDSAQLNKCNAAIAGVPAKTTSMAIKPQMALNLASLPKSPVALSATAVQDQQRKAEAFALLERKLVLERTPKLPMSVPLPKLSLSVSGAPASTSPRERRIASQGTDCNDNRTDVHPGLAEVCDGYDNDCDGNVDWGTTFHFFLDADGDGHGDPERAIDACPFRQSEAARSGRWLVLVGNDCNDADPLQWTGCP